MVSPWRLSAAHFGALGLAGVLFAVSPSQVYGFVSTSGGLSSSCCKHESHRRRSSGYNGAWGSHPEGSSCAALEQNAQRRRLRLAATPEDVEASEEGFNENSTSISTDNGSGEEEEVWARAELPMSNDVQVEQATRAVWKVWMLNRELVYLPWVCAGGP